MGSLLNLLNHPALDGPGLGVELTQKLSEREEMFEKRFQSTFKLQDKVWLTFSSGMSASFITLETFVAR